jgi:hypothetical protein
VVIRNHGRALRWDELDEDLSIAGLLRDHRAQSQS